MTISECIKLAFLDEKQKNSNKKYYTTSEVKNIVLDFSSTYKSGSIIPSDYCYNITNEDTMGKYVEGAHLFRQVTRGKYEFLGENYPYTGTVFHRTKDSEHPEIFGEWTNGAFTKLKKD